ncbi:hypothetical protein SAMN05216463_12050 [Xylanibacter ruminicola]|uniref:Uncharacterized protein n=1 Tax=Xylanibacter ruminicola TaxID=839 RepID=A0A1M6XGE1_XYLRU|nr:hypothetical protein SAMN05216463_12050 [Xylanibacter ruminicola]
MGAKVNKKTDENAKTYKIIRMEFANLNNFI